MVNVTYGCYDITVLCPVATASTTARRLEMDDDGPGDYHRNGGGTLDVGGPLEEDEMDVDMSIDGSGLDQSSHSYLGGDMVVYRQELSNASTETRDPLLSGNTSWPMQGLKDMNMSLLLSEHLSEIYRQLNSGNIDERNRQLKGGGGVGGKKLGQHTGNNAYDDLISNTFNTSATDDHSDDAPKEDDTFTVNTDVQVNQFGSIAAAVEEELKSVLSLNLSTIDLAKAAPVLAFVGCMVGIWLLGSLFFLRWDKSDRHRLVYLREYHVKAAYKLIKEDIHKGGTGVIDTGDIRKMVIGGAMDLQQQINRTLDVLKTSISPSHFFNPYKRNAIYAGTNGLYFLLFHILCLLVHCHAIYAG